MEQAWVDALNNKLSEFGDQLLSMYLWGIQTPELTQFLSQEMDIKTFNEVAMNTRQKCATGKILTKYKSLLLACLIHWACGAMDNASAYGAEDSRFESWQAQIFFFVFFL